MEMAYKATKYNVKGPNNVNININGTKFKLLPQDDYTLIIFRPYMTKKTEVIEEIIYRLTEMNFVIFRKKFIEKDRRFWEYFYPSSEEWLKNIGLRVLKDNKDAGINTKDIVGTNDPIKIGLTVKKWLCRDMARENGHALSMVPVGHNAATKIKEMFGAPIPIKAAPGTIRHDFGESDSNPLAFSQQRSVYNVGHCSNREEKRNGLCSIKFETSLIFPELFF